MSVSLGFFFLFGFLLSSTKSNPITNTNFNEHIREFSLKDNNSTKDTALNKEGLGRYANFDQNNPGSIKFSDNAIAASSYSRGSHHEYPGNGIYDHDETPYYNGQEYHLPFNPGYEHGYYESHGYGHANHGHHVGHYHHALASKALWPLAGIALLGAAAALVSNPILLQLGVATGKRRRRDTDSEPEISLDWLENTSKLPDHESYTGINSAQLPRIKVKKKVEDIKILSQDKDYIQIPIINNYK